jgi:hypothetical protein
MDQEESTSADFQKRFNDGYLIAKYMPELAEKLQSEKTLDGHAIKEGIEQFQQEQTKDLKPSWLTKDRTNLPDRDTSKDKDDKELDKD